MGKKSSLPAINIPNSSGMSKLEDARKKVAKPMGSDVFVKTMASVGKKLGTNAAPTLDARKVTAKPTPDSGFNPTMTRTGSKKNKKM